jgi:hypothetical protein
VKIKLQLHGLDFPNQALSINTPLDSEKIFPLPVDCFYQLLIVRSEHLALSTSELLGSESPVGQANLKEFESFFGLPFPDLSKAPRTTPLWLKHMGKWL